MIRLITENIPKELAGIKTLNSLDHDTVQAQTVRAILSDIQKNGDAAALQYSQTWDCKTLTQDQIKVSLEEIHEAKNNVTPELLAALHLAISNIREHHVAQKLISWEQQRPNGMIHGIRYTPLQRVGLYVPGGRAVYPSTVLMNAIPALVAGVNDLVMVTPANAEGKIHPLLLTAADELGIATIYKLGGAQAIAALAYGTETIAPVDKIVGPGNLFVALAKRAVYGIVDIDMIAGPSDIFIIADEHANPRWIAADLLSQAEHDPLASAILATPSLTLATHVQQEIKKFFDESPRQSILESSLGQHSAIIITTSITHAIEIANHLAPEHLELLLNDADTWLSHIKNAGAIFLGEYSPEAMGDYVAGTNHVLPTAGTARFSSPLGVSDFMKKSSIIQYTKAAFREEAPSVIALAKAEGLHGHALSVEVRLNEH